MRRPTLVLVVRPAFNDILWRRRPPLLLYPDSGLAPIQKLRLRITFRNKLNPTQSSDYRSIKILALHTPANWKTRPTTHKLLASSPETLNSRQWECCHTLTSPPFSRHHV